MFLVVQWPFEKHLPPQPLVPKRQTVAWGNTLPRGNWPKTPAKGVAENQGQQSGTVPGGLWKILQGFLVQNKSATEEQIKDIAPGNMVHLDVGRKIIARHQFIVDSTKNIQKTCFRKRGKILNQKRSGFLLYYLSLRHHDVLCTCGILCTLAGFVAVTLWLLHGNSCTCMVPMIRPLLKARLGRTSENVSADVSGGHHINSNCFKPPINQLFRPFFLCHPELPEIAYPANSAVSSMGPSKKTFNWVFQPPKRQWWALTESWRDSMHFQPGQPAEENESPHCWSLSRKTIWNMKKLEN